MTTGVDIRPYVKSFMQDNPNLLRIGKGDDPEYAEWFVKLLSHAAKGEAPIFYQDYWSLPVGYILVGDTTMPAPPTTMRLISWNIDGIKAHFETLKKLIDDLSPEIICLQKVKEVKDSSEFELDGYKRECNSRPYAGVITYVKNCIPCNFIKLDDPILDGHLLKTEIYYPSFTLYNIYSPYSNPSVDGAIEHRRKFDDKLNSIVCTTPDRQIICGDMNIVATDHDCWDGKYQRNQANFHEWERQNFIELCCKGHLIDSFRVFHPFTKEFTYFFRNDPEVRAKNHGHRIDYFLTSRSFEPQIKRAEILKDYVASSNNPILLELKY
ncbi:MAG: endonuclease/exonuclease/phosphatase family protein [Muribaculaceae bacterium]|nr:endonuclease/exonuclease/phosphatase family protein [Muribaculaceae bacterium]